MGDRPVILVIDASENGRTALAVLLRGRGYVVLSVRSGTEALHLLRVGFRPSVILLDLVTPGDGLSFRVRQMADPDLAEIPVIAGASLAEAQDHIDPTHRVVHMLRDSFDVDRLLQWIE
jgi:CheY-like chemotaxis protein